MAIDMHAHWTPRGLITASASGADWYGWRIIRDQYGREFAASSSHTVNRAVSQSTLMDPSARAAIRKEKDSIDFEALLLNGSFYNYDLDEADSARFCREINEELAEVQVAYPDRFRGIAILPMPHQNAALKELDYAIGKLGLRAVATLSNVRGLNLDEPSILPILTAAAEMDVAIFVHPTIVDPGDRFPRYFFWNSFGAPLESSLAAMSVVYSGLLDRHPQLRIMFTQGGGWIQYGVGRLDLRYQQYEKARPMKRPPAEYLTRMYFDCLVHDEDALALLVKRAGSEHVFVGTDYPAGGDIPGGAVRWIKECTLLSPDVKEKILWKNAKTFLRLA